MGPAYGKGVSLLGIPEKNSKDIQRDGFINVTPIDSKTETDRICFGKEQDQSHLRRYGFCKIGPY